MVTESAGGTDKRLGYSIVFGVLVVAGALAMLLEPGELIGAAGFAIAIGAGLAVITALHLVAE